ncbi:hypothetical protein GWK47_034191 [Chionoecetes opilio]|uniref:Uncharacterized protein n=1 Tax=Chionoecetes opilio TaxID=41210 RepID=A0A8J4YRG6_CHIOP|nr:hypothetical protein GWK47_034191 [Chionoecetes opilio]
MAPNDPELHAPPVAAPSLTPTIKILHQEPLVKRFSGEDPSYSALNCLGLCEDLMRNSSLVLDLHKIAFVRSQLVPDSLAARMMLASALQPGLLNNSYHEFRDNFLQAFGSGQHRGGLQWVFRMTDSLTNRLGTADHFDGQALAAQIVDDAVSSLRKADWFKDDAISCKDLRVMLEYAMFVVHLIPERRRVASSIDFTAKDRLLVFALTIEKRIAESCLRVPPAPSPHNTPIAPVMFSAAGPSAPPPLLGSFCSRTGQTSQPCFRRTRQGSFPPPSSHSRDNASARSYSDAATRPPPLLPSPRSQPSRSFNKRGGSQTPLFCHVHGFGGHGSDDCFTLLNMRDRRASQVHSSLPQSGEVSRRRPAGPD